MESNPVINVAIFIIARINGIRASSGLGTGTAHENESSRETSPTGLDGEERSLAGGGIWPHPTNLSSVCASARKESLYSFTHLQFSQFSLSVVSDSL